MQLRTNRRQFILSAYALAISASVLYFWNEAPASAREKEAKRKISIHVGGLICPFCTFNVEKQLRKVAGVQSVSTELKTGIVTVVPKKGSRPSPRAMWDAVVQAGFKPSRIVTPQRTYTSRPSA